MNLCKAPRTRMPKRDADAGGFVVSEMVRLKCCKFAKFSPQEK